MLDLLCENETAVKHRSGSLILTMESASNLKVLDGDAELSTSVSVAHAKLSLHALSSSV